MKPTRANAYEIPSVEIALALWRRKHLERVAAGAVPTGPRFSQPDPHVPRRDEPR